MVLSVHKQISIITNRLDILERDSWIIVSVKFRDGLILCIFVAHKYTLIPKSQGHLRLYFFVYFYELILSIFFGGFN